VLGLASSGQAMAWDAGSGAALWPGPLPLDPPGFANQSSQALAYEPTSAPGTVRVVTRAGHRRATVLDPEKGEVLRRLDSSGFITAVAVYDDVVDGEVRTRVAVAGGAISIYDEETGALLVKINHGGSSASSLVAYRPAMEDADDGGCRLISGHFAGTLRMWRPREDLVEDYRWTACEESMYEIHELHSYVSPDGHQRLLVCNTANAAVVFDLGEATMPVQARTVRSALKLG
jgi:hypothetical protein